MSPELTSLLKQISGSKAGLELADIINKGRQLPKFQPGKGEEQTEAWKFYSGCEFERDRILKILLLKEIL